jgi:hypothetical protein
MLWYRSDLNRISRYIPVTGIYFPAKVYTRMYFDVQLRKVYTLMYENGYVYTIHGTYEYIAV